jgi:hypothetical protein
MLSKVVQQYKRQVTIEIKHRNYFNEKIWRKLFYDRIIRNEKELFRIRKYIDLNPLQWELDNCELANLDI